MAYTWIPFYKEMSQKLLQFRNNRGPLVDWIYGNIDGSLIKHFKDAPDGRRVPDTDPFSVMAIINRGISYDKKVELCKQFKSFLNISEPAPQDFAGVPEMDNRRSNFMAFEEKRKEGDIERLWNLFECAVLGKDIQKAYNALNGQLLIRYNITMGLFWVRPDIFLALDGNNKDKLVSLGIASFDGKFVPYDEYVGIMERLDAKMASGEVPCSNYAEFSHTAYKQNDGASTRDLPRQNGSNSSDSTKSYWTFSPGENASKWHLCVDKGIMCLGWDALGDLSKYASREDMRTEIKKQFPTDGNAKNDSLAVWQFSREMKIGDVVFAKKGRDTIIGRGIVESDYYFDENFSNFKHIRKIKWENVGEWKTDDTRAMKTLTNITRDKETVEKLNRLFESPDKVGEPLDPPTSDNYWWLVANPHIWSLSDMKVGEQQEYSLYNEKNNKRRIFQHFMDAKKGDKVLGYEARSTQEVVCLLEISKENDGEEIGFKKIETLPNPISFSTLKNTPGLEDMEYMINQQGSFFKVTPKEFEIVMKLARGEKPIEKENYSKEDFLKQVFVSQNDYERLESLLLRKKNLILQGAPGVGKTYAAKRLAYAIMGEKDDDRIMQVQFHQNYSYEDFVMGYKPNDNGGFVLKPGKFYNFCKDAEKDRDHEYFFIIDEINRGNLSKIFGELLMLIESDYRDKEIELSYNDEKFSVPSNVYIIGMMNTADRSLAMIDYALRRRFSFFEMKPGFETPQFKAYIREKKDTKLDKLVNAIVELNKLIESDDSLGSGFCIGHSYLCELGTKYNLDSIVEYDIIPMLREYWFDNNERFNQEALKLKNALIE